MTYTITIDEQTWLKKIIENAIGHIIMNDQMIIKDGQERALSNRLGMYLFRDFSGWDVDCEYNRVGLDRKQKRTSSNNARTPDIIIHRRGWMDIDNNLLWIEVKIENGDAHQDTEKLKEFTAEPVGTREIQYKYALSVSFCPSINMTWFRAGAIIE